MGEWSGSLVGLGERPLASISGCRLIKNLNYQDGRGVFKKIFPIPNELSMDDFIVRQVNISENELAGTVRGLHYQGEPFLESKLITCIKGSIFDLILDMRPSSPTFGHINSYHLTPTSGSLLIPPLIAHGFQSLEDGAVIIYLHSREFDKVYSRGINVLDPKLDINWPLPISRISESDTKLPFFSDLVI